MSIPVTLITFCLLNISLIFFSEVGVVDEIPVVDVTNAAPETSDYKESREGIIPPSGTEEDTSLGRKGKIGIF